MKKTIVAAATLGMFGASAHAQSSVTLYGLIDAGVTYANKVATSSGHGKLVKYGDGVASGSRWGIRGTEDLGGGLKALFVLESGFSSGDGTLGQGGALFGRQAFVGLSKNGVGSLTFGRQYSFSTDYIGGNYTMGSQTPAGNYAYHINDLDQLTSSRINNAVKFQSANFAGLTFGAMYGFSNSTQFAGAPTTSSGGTTTQGASSAYSFGANYAQGPFGIGAAYTNIRFPGGATPAFGVSIANVNTLGLRDLETFGIGARYAIAAALVWANWTHTKFEPLSGEASKLNNYEIGGRYAFTPALSAGLGYTFSKLDDRFEGKWHQVNAAVDYALSKRTDVYVSAAYQKASGSNTVNGRVVPVQAEIGSSASFIGNAGANTQFVTRIGLRHKF
ncbi:porin [Burkholderia pseudomultivorans]|uniref:Porin n=1 Tax=Burkholderia pseudomultivorans TaxID=1207504 RepID=A0A132E814_9BURK|nr:porin [Burkholderia pseudomultivorans]KWF18692.1 porin [Burkholderia pseudomultivorans]MDR8730850.1 Outer membrane porin protein [Burkholderia pseudomultivorans]MDR8738625.1 Outer membrane porin protein [Burkholderia pseudomultivorans]MDR8745130.1 Outer membrane porin protein [Burkholderia pseudomultivorans]MDR8757164.1 Outer membrane porin protein [Burkholderia pseudomultivorans]